MKDRKRYLILGAGPAGINAARTIRKLDRLAIITVVSADREIYSKAMLHLYITGERDLEGIKFIDEDFFKKYRITWVPGVTATHVRTDSKSVFFDNNQVIPYDKLLIATGSSAAIPENISRISQANNAYGLRNLADANRLKRIVKDRSNQRATVLGGGLVGIFMTTELVKAGIEVDLIEYGNNILALQLDPTAAKPYHNKLISKGVNIHTNCIAQDVILDLNNRYRGFELSNGDTVSGDFAVLATGMTPNNKFLRDTDLLMDRGLVEIRGKVLSDGILVNRKCETNMKDIYAAGDVCAEKISIWPLAVQQGIVAGYNMVGRKKEMSNTFGLRNSMNFFGLNTISIGDPNLEGHGYVHESYRNGDIYKKVIHKDGIIKSIILQGDISYAGVYEYLIENQVDISHINKDIFDLGYADFFKIDNYTGTFDFKTPK